MRRNLAITPVKSYLLLSIAISVSTASHGQLEGSFTAETATPNDGQILQIVRTLNNGEIAQAELAKDQASSDTAKNVAEMILMDHQRSNNSMGAIDIDLEPSTLSESLERTAMQTLEQLQNAGEGMFDCAYLSVQVEQHQLALEIASSNLAPHASSEAVTAFLDVTTPRLENHLQAAQTAMEDASCSDPRSPGID